MAGKRDEAQRAAAVAEWLDGAFEQLRRLTDEAIAVITAAEPPADVAEAEKRARALGVMARTAKAVAALQPSSVTGRKARDSHEDAMSEDDRELSDDEERNVRDELKSRLDHLFRVAERKGFGLEMSGPDTTRRLAEDAAGDPPAERRPGLAP